MKKNVTSKYQNKIDIAAKKFAIQAPLIHGNDLDFSNSVYTGSKKDIEVKCLIHGPYTTTPGSILQGCGCQKCGRKKPVSRNLMGF